MFEANPEVTFVNRPAPPRKVSFQLSLKAVSIVVAILAFAISAIVFTPVAAIAAIVLTIVFATFAVVTLFYGRGWVRPFAGGFLLPTIFSFFAFFEVGRHGPEQVLMLFFGCLFASVLLGTIAAASHGFLRRRNGMVRVPEIPVVRNLFNND